MTDSDLPHWEANLDSVIVLRDGTRLCTLRDASACVAKNFGWSRGIIYAATYRQLRAAAETGHAPDITDAQRMVELLLVSEQMM